MDVWGNLRLESGPRRFQNSCQQKARIFGFYPERGLHRRSLPKGFLEDDLISLQVLLLFPIRVTLQISPDDVGENLIAFHAVYVSGPQYLRQLLLVKVETLGKGDVLFRTTTTPSAFIFRAESGEVMFHLIWGRAPGIRKQHADQSK